MTKFTLDAFLTGLTKEVRALDDAALDRAVKLCGKWFEAEKDEIRGALAGKRSAKVAFIMGSDPVMTDDGLAGFAESLRTRGILEAHEEAEEKPAKKAEKVDAAPAKKSKAKKAAPAKKAKSKKADDAPVAATGKSATVSISGNPQKVVEMLGINREVGDSKVVVVKRAAYTATAVPNEGVVFKFKTGAVPKVVKYFRNRLEDKDLRRIRIETSAELPEKIVERLELRSTSKGYAIA